MKRHFHLFAAVGTFLHLASSTTADWSLSLVHVSDQATTGAGPSAGFGPSSTWHIRAQFDSGTDVLGVLSKARQPMFLNLIHGNIFNQVTVHADHQNFPPTAAQQGSPLDWKHDTFVTIGKSNSQVPLDQDPTLAFTPGFANLLNNLTGSWNTADLPTQEGGWIAIDMPDFAHGTDLLLMQLTVSQGALFEIVFGLDTLQLGYLHDWDGISFATHGTSGSGASYLTNIPAPGTITIALLALAAPRVRRRRRLS